jgi:hypothetical protein
LAAAGIQPGFYFGGAPGAEVRGLEGSIIGGIGGGFGGEKFVQFMRQKEPGKINFPRTYIDNTKAVIPIRLNNH